MPKTNCNLTESEHTFSDSALDLTLDLQGKTKGNPGEAVVFPKNEPSLLKELKELWHRSPEY